MDISRDKWRELHVKFVGYGNDKKPEKYTLNLSQQLLNKMSSEQIFWACDNIVKAAEGGGCDYIVCHWCL